MAAERKPGSNRGRPALDWNQAFLFYAALPLERRSYAEVAAEFGVSPRTVERHGRKERWRERARELDRQASRTAAARLVEERAATLTDFERLVEASLLGYAQKLREGTLRLTAADLPRLHKLLRELWQEPPLEPSGLSEPSPTEPGEEPASLEHKLQVLQALQEAGLLEQRERPQAEQLDQDQQHDHPQNDDRDRDCGGAEQDELPRQDGGPR
jgi:transposase